VAQDADITESGRHTLTICPVSTQFALPGEGIDTIDYRKPAFNYKRSLHCFAAD
jgi:hypothetical protein